MRLNVVIVGNGVAGISAAMKLRERDTQAAITVIGDESDYFFSRPGLMYAYMDRMSIRDLEPFERKIYRQQRITRIRDRVTELDAVQQCVYTASGALPYDRLLLATGSVARRPDWQGLDCVQSGVVTFVSLPDLDRCERLTRPGLKAVIVGGGLIGVELAECLRHHDVQVSHLVRERWYMQPKLSAPEGTMVEEEIARHGVDLKTNEAIVSVEAGPGGDLAAVRTTTGRRIDCRLLGVCIGVEPNVDWLRCAQTPPEMRRGVVVDAAFRTSLPNVFACGDCAEVVAPPLPAFVEQTWYSAKRQGELAALSMLGDQVSYQPPIFFTSAKFFGIEYTAVGTMAETPGSEFFVRIPRRRISLRIHEGSDNVVRGFSMLGSRWDSARFERWIERRRPLAYVVEHLEEAQFDVEFGGQSLEQVRAAYSEQPVLQ